MTFFRRFLLLSSAFFLFCEADAAPKIHVEGRSELKLVPDTAFINIGVKTLSKSASFARKKNSEKMNEILKKLKSFGIPKKHIQTKGFQVSESHEYDHKLKRSVLKGYNVVNTLEVKVTQISRLGEIIDNAISKGGNSVNSLRFESSKKKEKMLKLLEDATSKAILKARTIAQSTGNKKIRVLEVSEGFRQADPIRPRMYAKRALGAETMTADSGGTQISAGTLTLKAQVQLTAEAH